MPLARTGNGRCTVYSQPEAATDFEDESVELRLARRGKTGIGSVTISPPLNLSLGSGPSDAAA